VAHALVRATSPLMAMPGATPLNPPVSAEPPHQSAAPSGPVAHQRPRHVATPILSQLLAAADGRFRDTPAAAQGRPWYPRNHPLLPACGEVDCHYCALTPCYSSAQTTEN
jgi:hypothetical protein